MWLMSTNRHQTAPSMADCPWQVCIEDDNGIVLGAGIMLDGETVLTCAHVAGLDPGDPDTADLPEIRLKVWLDWQDEPARVDAGIAGLPLGGGPGSDVVLLRLRSPVNGHPRTRLRRAWHRHRTVSMLGYPQDVRYGIRTSATIKGPAAGGSHLVQLNVPPGEPMVERGFSGTAVIDSTTGEIVGMVKSIDTQPGNRVSWMIDVGEIVKQLPLVHQYVALTSDAESTGDAPAAALSDTGLLHELAQRIGSDSQSTILVFVGGPGSGQDALIHRLIRPGDNDSEASTARPGGIEVAVRADGKTPEEVFRELAEGLGGGPSAGDRISDVVSDLGSPLVPVVVTGVDRAQDPDRLLDTLVTMMTANPPPPLQLLLGFDEAAPERVQDAVVSDFTDPEDTGQPPGGFGPSGPDPDPGARLNLVAGLLESLTSEERDLDRVHAHVAKRIVNTPPRGVRAAPALELRLAVLRNTRTQPAAARWQSDLIACERSVRTVRGRVAEAEASLEELLSRRDQLRAELDSYQLLAAKVGDDDEDEALSREYRFARDLAWRGPCDLAAAEAAVAGYYRAVRRATGA